MKLILPFLEQVRRRVSNTWIISLSLEESDGTQQSPWRQRYSAYIKAPDGFLKITEKVENICKTATQHELRRDVPQFWSEYTTHSIIGK